MAVLPWGGIAEGKKVRMKEGILRDLQMP